MLHPPVTLTPTIPADLDPKPFPPHFVWGAATAAYQIEGAAAADGRGASIWDTFSKTPGKTLNGDTGDVACDHYHRWRDDIALMQQLGLNAYRFSIAWPRIIPNGTGAVNQAGLDFYDRLVDGLLAAGITPWATLYHWDLPQPLEDRGGWPNRHTAEAFAAYADVISRRLGDRVGHWITLNEPWCSAHLGYASGEHAPGRTSLRDALAASHHLLLGHGLAVAALRANSPQAKVGITLNFSPTYTLNDTPENAEAMRRWDGFFNRWYLDPIAGRGFPADMCELYGDLAPTVPTGDFATMAAPIDFLGINYYSPAFVEDNPEGDILRIRSQRLPDAEYTAMDWAVCPEALFELLERLHRDYAFPELYITENGAAYPDEPQGTNGSTQIRDAARQRYYQQHLAAVQYAIAAQIPIKGYFAWSLLDNFEWGFGYSKRFGLVYVDYATQDRTIKQSGHYYAQVTRGRRLPSDDLQA